MERSGALPRSPYWEAEERGLDPGLAGHSLQPLHRLQRTMCSASQNSLSMFASRRVALGVP